MGAQPDTSTSAPEVRHGIRQILAPIFVAKLLATYLVVRACSRRRSSSSRRAACVVFVAASSGYKPSAQPSAGAANDGVIPAVLTDSSVTWSDAATCDSRCSP